RPLALLRADPGEPVGPFTDDLWHVRERLDVVDERGVAPQPLLRGVGGPRPRRAALPHDRGHQRRLLAAHERPGADADVDWEVEARAEQVRAEQADAPGLLDGRVEPLDRQRVLAARVDITLAGADRVAGDGHALEHAVRVALQHAAVHERAGVALVGVAHDEL